MEHGAVEWTLAVVALAIMVGPTLVSRFRLPGVIGLVLVGLLAGPYVLNLLDEAAMGTLGSIGLLYLMFQAGLEIDLAQFDANQTGGRALRAPDVRIPVRSWHLR